MVAKETAPKRPVPLRGRAVEAPYKTPQVFDVGSAKNLIRGPMNAAPYHDCYRGLTYTRPDCQRSD